LRREDRSQEKNDGYRSQDYSYQLVHNAISLCFNPTTTANVLVEQNADRERICRACQMVTGGPRYARFGRSGVVSFSRWLALSLRLCAAGRRRPWHSLCSFVDRDRR
jgi:hypothetical protein